MPRRKNTAATNNNNNNKKQGNPRPKSNPTGIVGAERLNIPREIAKAALSIAKTAAPFPFNAIASGISKISGFGDYKVRYNTLHTEGGAVSAVPQFAVKLENNVTHRECLGTLISQGDGFAFLKKLTFNPTNKELFPWLSNIAQNYTTYRVNGAVVTYETNSSDYATNSALGTVCIATRYDSREPDFVSMVDMQNSQFAVSAKPSLNILHPLECDPEAQAQKLWFNRRGGETSTAYGYDKCRIYVASEGLTAPAGAVIGRLWLSYDITLMSPSMPLENAGLLSQLDVWAWYSTNLRNAAAIMVNLASTIQSSVSNYTAYKLLKHTGTRKAVGEQDYAADVTTSGNSMRFYKPGTWEITVIYGGTGLPLGDQVATAITNVGGASGRYWKDPNASGNTATLHQYHWQVIIDDAPNTLTDYVEVTFNDLATGGTVSNVAASVRAVV